MDTGSISTTTVAMEVDCKITTENTKKTSTLGRSRKKKAAPQPPGTNKGGSGGGGSASAAASDTEKSTTSKNKNSATYKSASSGKKASGGASGSKSTKHQHSPASEEFLAFKVRVRMNYLITSQLSRELS